MILKDFKCRNALCKRVVAQTDGADLYFDGKKVYGEPMEVAFICKFCKMPVRWISLKRKVLAKSPLVA